MYIHAYWSHLEMSISAHSHDWELSLIYEDVNGGQGLGMTFLGNEGWRGERGLDFPAESKSQSTVEAKRAGRDQEALPTCMLNVRITHWRMLCCEASYTCILLCSYYLISVVRMCMHCDVQLTLKYVVRAFLHFHLKYYYHYVQYNLH